MTPDENPVFAAAHAAAQAWAAAMRQRKQPCVMAPWDENVLCLEPLLTVYQFLQGVNTQIAPPNPQRVGLIMTANSPSVAGVLVSPGKAIDPNTPRGLSLPAQASPFMITQKDWLNLVSAAWYCLHPSSSVEVAVIEIALRDWPKV